MGHVVLFASVSVDGFFAGPDGELDWQRVDEELHTHFNVVLAGMAAFLGGRVTWELMADYWPTADSDTGASRAEREFAGIWRDKPKVVYSRTLSEAGWGTTIERSVEPEAVRALVAGGDVVLGGADVASTFLSLGLVDELRLYVHPTAIGRGRRLLAPDLVLDLSLLETRTFGSGVVMLRYAVDGGVREDA
jgi:dihydrofolate reductase